MLKADWGDTSTSEENPKIVRKPPEAGGQTRNRFSS
jgi:hypothetical protein